MRVPDHILVTGFGPFPGVDDNPTASLLRALRKDNSHCETRLLTLPVSFAHVLTDVIAAYQAHHPTKILHLGVATESNRIRIETNAYNHIQARVPDIEGRQPRNARINRAKPPSDLLLGSPSAERLVDSLNDHDLPAATSTDAGRYVCNALFYASLSRFGASSEVSFVHVPAVETPYPDSPSNQIWTHECLSRALEIIVRAL